MGRLLAGLDQIDGLLVVGVVFLVGGIGALNRPAAFITFGVLCIGLWLRKTRRAK